MNTDYNHRHFVSKSGHQITVAEDKLNIFYTDNTIYRSWQPLQTIKPYNALKQMVIDIETSGLIPSKDKIFAIGCMNELGEYFVFMDENESNLLCQFISYFQSIYPDLVLTYNGTDFDFPFIITRCLINNISHPFTISQQSRIIKTAQVFGKPMNISEIFISNSQHIDVYICVLRWDFVNKALYQHSLKSAVIEMGLRASARLVLTPQEIQHCWGEGAGSQGWETIRKYLIYDLEDTKLIADKLVPSYYYESLIVPGMNLQQLSLTGNGTKWQRVLERQYPGYKPTADPKLKFEGGLVISVPGLHKHIAKIDVSSLYPSIMLKYGICSRKDTQRVGLSILDYLTRERLRLKELGKAGDLAAKQAEAALKVLINSLFGFYGTSGVGFNDMEAAALVTAYGRRILRFMIDVIEKAGGIQVESDTDGVFFSHSEPLLIFEKLQNALPTGINIELEILAKAMFVPSRGAKNYIIWHEDGKITTKGSWRKRDRSRLEKEFPLNYLTQYLLSKAKAEQYYQELTKVIRSGDFPVEQLQVTRKIKKGEKALLVLGNTGDVVTFYQGIRGLTNSEAYSSGYYLELIAKKRDELLSVVEPQGNVGKQLSLF
ncbi:ribonuclease H-like domain-containing protein [Sphaerospermopsis sp. FACHB-1094]|uniref:DNA polymerase domain-containing protein n=1 Tax=Sphaerospermopsis sp. FACHB-1094 TaxID=2692861 RepID=UPI001683CF21|nr:DNA polymerase domain-containing protein [Sphaerospermopsis sp. FACHB-1094]MBD2131057.1 ribonuclease H-like domain-containing protein [Sphaerospermopsis sp. FACHB-1094]